MSHFPRHFLDNIHDATPDEWDKARKNLAADVIAGRVSKDTARTVADALDLWDEHVTPMPPPRRHAPHRMRTNARTVTGSRTAS